MSKRNFTWGQLMEADGRLANFERAKLCKAELTDASLSQTNFKGANLNKTDFAFVTFHKADLSGADLRESTRKIAACRAGGAPTKRFNTPVLSPGEYGARLLKRTVFPPTKSVC